jgi:hypothetical protein
VFRRAPEFVIPDALAEIIEDIDGAGQSLEQIAKESLSNVLETGRHILLVDYPSIGDVDAETEARMGLHPTIASYPAESLINWRFEGVAGRQQLTLAVLHELVDTADDEYGHETESRYRVLRLRDRVYTQQIYKESGERKSTRRAWPVAACLITSRFI